MDRIVVNQDGSSASIEILPPVSEELIDDLKQVLKNLIQSGTINISLNMKSVQYLHTPALGVIVFTHRNLEKNNGRLVLKHVNPPLMHLFNTFGLVKVLHIEE